MSKTDQELGKRVQAHLIAAGVETPMHDNKLSAAEKKAIIQARFTDIMNALGLDLSDDSLQDTPRRVAKMYVDEIFYGLDYSNFPKCTAVENKMGYNEMLVEKNINVQSNCEHHFVTISGSATVGYIPGDTVIGLSKINRLVAFFAKRPQIQERLTEQIYHALCYILDTENVAVVIDAEHYCVKSRGVQDVGSSTVTSRIGGLFLDPAVRAEFMALARGAK